MRYNDQPLTFGVTLQFLDTSAFASAFCIRTVMYIFSDFLCKRIGIITINSTTPHFSALLQPPKYYMSLHGVNLLPIHVHVVNVSR